MYSRGRMQLSYKCTSVVGVLFQFIFFHDKKENKKSSLVKLDSTSTISFLGALETVAENKPSRETKRTPTKV